jgi:hypothetical protein
MLNKANSLLKFEIGRLNICFLLSLDFALIFNQ